MIVTEFWGEGGRRQRTRFPKVYEDAATRAQLRPFDDLAAARAIEKVTAREREQAKLEAWETELRAKVLARLERMAITPPRRGGAMPFRPGARRRRLALGSPRRPARGWLRRLFGGARG